MDQQTHEPTANYAAHDVADALDDAAAKAHAMVRAASLAQHGLESGELSNLLITAAELLEGIRDMSGQVRAIGRA